MYKENAHAISSNENFPSQKWDVFEVINANIVT